MITSIAFRKDLPPVLPGSRAPWWKSAAAPRIKAISQFDYGRLKGVNCTMAAGAMLANLAYGIVTTGSQLRALQGDQSGGTGFWDLNNAMEAGWGVKFARGRLTPLQFRALLWSGAGAAIHVDYGLIEQNYSYQPRFKGAHSIYLDAFRDGPNGPEYFVMDPLGPTWRGYQGTWWPAGMVEAAAMSFGNQRIVTAWAYASGIRLMGKPPKLPVDSYPIKDKPKRGENPKPADPPTPETDPIPPGSTPDQNAPKTETESPTTPAEIVPNPGGVKAGFVSVRSLLSACVVTLRPAFCPIGLPGEYPLLVASFSPPPLMVPSKLDPVVCGLAATRHRADLLHRPSGHRSQLVVLADGQRISRRGESGNRRGGHSQRPTGVDGHVPDRIRVVPVRCVGRRYLGRRDQRSRHRDRGRSVMSMEREDSSAMDAARDATESDGIGATEGAAAGATVVGAAAIGAGVGTGTSARGGLGGAVSHAAGSVVSALGPTGLAAVGGGALLGIVAMAGLIASGAVQPHPAVPGGNASTSLALVSCAGGGPVVAMADPGVKMLFTGRSADGGWVQVYVPGPAIPYGWAPAGAVQVQGDIASLPIASCSPDIAEVPQPSASSADATASPSAPAPSRGPTAAPSAAPSSGKGTGSTGTGGGTPSHAPPSAPPSNPPPAGPVFGSALTSSVPGIYTDPSEQEDCYGLPFRSTFSVAVSAPDGLAGVRLWEKTPGAADYVQLNRAMFNYSGLWKVSLTAGNLFMTQTGSVSLRVVATDTKGRTSTSKPLSFKVTRCDTDATISGGVSDELPSNGTGGIDLGYCTHVNPVAWFFSVKDPDGAVSSAVISLTFSDGQAPKTASLHHSLATHWTGATTFVPDDYSVIVNWVLKTTDVQGGTTFMYGSNQFTCRTELH